MLMLRVHCYLWPIVFVTILYFMVCTITEAEQDQSSYSGSGRTNIVREPSGKDKWDLIKIIGGISVPLVVAFGAAMFGTVLKRSFERAMIRNAAVNSIAAFFPILISGSPRERECALATIRELGEAEWGKEMAGRLRSVLVPTVSAGATEIRSESQRALYGWVETLLAFVCFSDGSIRPGTVIGKWVLFPFTGLLSGTVFHRQTPYMFYKEDIHVWSDYSIAACRIGCEATSVKGDNGEAMEYKILGYSRIFGEIILVRREVGTLERNEGEIYTDADSDSGLAGFVAVRSGRDSVAGIVSGRVGDDCRLTIVRWQEIEEFLRRCGEQIEDSA